MQRFVTTEADPAQSEPQASADLVARLARGERAAVAELDCRYRRGLMFLVMRRTGNVALAEDVCQDTLITAIEKLCPPQDGAPARGIDKPESLGAFLRGIALNKLTAVWRKETRQATAADSDAVDQAVDESDGPIEHIADDETRAAVKEALDGLPVPRDRDILMSVYLRDEDRGSICQRLGVDAAHFNRVLSRAKKRFREAIERADGERRQQHPLSR
jgi:RNA polymerase sigma-70 factor (ECF subfamily)